MNDENFSVTAVPKAVSMRGRKTRIILLCLLCIITSAAAEDVFQDLCSFEKPDAVKDRVIRGLTVTFRTDPSRPYSSQVMFRLRIVGLGIEEGKRVTIHPVSIDEVETNLVAYVRSFEGAKPFHVEKSSLGKLAALRVRTQMPFGSRKALQYTQDDIYWARVSPNEVLEVRFTGQDDAALKTATEWMPLIKITPSTTNSVYLQQILKF